jgi:Zn-dependent protease with chaperone function
MHTIHRFSAGANIALRLSPCQWLFTHVTSISRSRPSLAKRAAIAVAVLGSFYVTAFAIAAVLIPLPVVVFLKMGHVRPMPLLLVTACCWTPAYGLVTGLLGARPARFSEPGLPLGREHAPSLFAMIDEVASLVGTAPPSEIYISALPVFFVAETGGGFFGRKSRRILCIGAPFLATFSIGELRSVIAHELGHYAGGDTRVAGILAFTEGAFRSVLRSTEENPLHQGTTHWMLDAAAKLSSFVGESLVKIFMRIYLALTRPLGRKEELAADALSAAVAGREVAIRALESAHVTGPLYRTYLHSEVGTVVEAGALPTDLLDGYRRFREGLELHGKIAELSRIVSEEKTDPFDTHPALADRVAALRLMPDAIAPRLEANGRALLDGTFDVDAWLVDATDSLVEKPLDAPPLARMPWREIETAFMPPKVLAGARDTAAKLFGSFPRAPTLAAMFAAVVAAFEAGRVHEIALTVHPEASQLFQQVPRHRAEDILQRLATSIVLSLFEGALIEHGAIALDSLGERSRVYGFANEPVRAGVICADAMKNDIARRELTRWATLLSAQPASEFPTPPGFFHENASTRTTASFA